MGQIRRGIINLVCYALPIVLVWLPVDVSAWLLVNMGVSLTLLAANFYAKSETLDRRDCSTHLGQTASVGRFILLLGRRVLTETGSGVENEGRW